jgi:nucleolar protein TMA23
MNAQSLLQAQGWGGPGTALQKGGVKRAILSSKKVDNAGLGAKPKESDQWWDNVFSAQLQNIQVCSSNNGKGTAIKQVNGGVSAAHPVAARAAHKRMFDGKSALEKVFVMGEVLKAGDLFVPLSKEPSATRSSEAMKTQESAIAIALQSLSDKQIAKEVKRMKKEAKAARKVQRAEKRQQKLARQEARIAKLEQRNAKKLKSAEALAGT